MILHDLMSFEILRVIWWLLLGVLLIGYALTDGFDLGVGALLPFVAKNDLERRVAINTIGPIWEGNQVWFILGGGAIFAAWPPLYAVSFSGFYIAMFLILASLILRPVGFKYRSKRESAAWRNGWDWALFVGGFVPALVFGVAVGNVLKGVPFYLAEDMRVFYTGSFFGLLNPFALLTGLVSLSMLVMHGGAWLALKSDGMVAQRAKAYGSMAALATVVLFVLAGLWVAVGIDGYAFTAPAITDGPSNPLLSDVAKGGSWMGAYASRPWIAIAPIMGIAGALLAYSQIKKGNEVWTLLSSKLSILGIISTVGLTMFPFILPSSIDPKSSLTVWDSSSSHLTLFVMMVCAVFFVPLILAYTAWVYKVLWGKVTEADIASNHQSY